MESSRLPYNADLTCRRLENAVRITLLVSHLKKLKAFKIAAELFSAFNSYENHIVSNENHIDGVRIM